MNIVAKTRGAQFTPAGVLLLPLDVQARGETLRFLSDKTGPVGPAHPVRNPIPSRERKRAVSGKTAALLG